MLGTGLAMVRTRFTLVLLLLVGIVTLLFGVWPLNFFAENQVRWLADQDGIQFYKQGLSSRRATGGVIYSDSPLDIRTETHSFEPTTIEISFEAHGGKPGGLAHVVSFYDGYRRSLLVIGQRKSHLVIRSRVNRNEARDTCREIGLEHEMSPNEKKLITIASGVERTDIYVNGELARSYDVQMLIGVEHFRGHLNLGNSSIGHNAWTGNLYGLALYDELLTSEQIRQHYMLWANNPEDIPAAVEFKPMILYSFDERAGASVRNRVGNANHLSIPPAFKPLKSSISIRFWRDMAWDRGLIVDILVNVLGFIPLGYSLIMLFGASKHLSRSRATFLAVLAAASFSLIIEISQTALPTRTSSLLDLLCNTLGAVLGIMAFRIIENKRSL